MNQQKGEDWRLTAFWIGLALATLIAGFVFGWSWRDRSGALASVSILNVLTALGTVGATVAAVGIAGWQYHVQRQEKYVEAVLVIGEAYPRLAVLLAALIRGKKFFGSLENVDHSPEDIRRELASIREALQAAQFPSANQLVPLGGTFAIDAAIVLSQLNSALSMAEADNLMLRTDRVSTGETMHNSLSVAHPRVESLAQQGYDLLNRDFSAAK